MNPGLLPAHIEFWWQCKFTLVGVVLGFVCLFVCLLYYNYYLEGKNNNSQASGYSYSYKIITKRKRKKKNSVSLILKDHTQKNNNNMRFVCIRVFACYVCARERATERNQEREIVHDRQNLPGLLKKIKMPWVGSIPLNVSILPSWALYFRELCLAKFPSIPCQFYKN